MKKICCILMFTLLILSIKTEVKAESDSSPVIDKELIYLDEGYSMQITTIIYNDSQITFATTSTKSVSRIYEIKNIFGNTVASYTLNGRFSYDGNTATCLSATYSTSVESALWSFDNATASKAGAKAIGNFTAKTLIPPQTITQTLSITCSKTGEIT